MRTAFTNDGCRQNIPSLKFDISDRYLEARVQNYSLAVFWPFPETPMPTCEHKGQRNVKNMDA
jgi:hypothetical protein